MYRGITVSLKLLLLSFRLIQTHPVATRSVVFEHILRNKRLAGSVLESWRSLSLITCSMKCSKHPKCRSFNFCFSQTCELNSEDVFSNGWVTSDLFQFQSVHDCSYVGMMKKDLPFCKEGSEMKKNSERCPSRGVCHKWKES